MSTTPHIRVFPSKFYILYFTFFISFSSCSINKQLARSAKETIHSAASLQNAHVGISIFDPETNKFLYDFQGDKYFVPASNTKIPTCYAAMKYLGDSIPGLKYAYYNDSVITIFPTGDPSFLHADFKTHPVLEFLKSKNTTFYFSNSNWNEDALGSGWSWNDYNNYYMAERSAFPVHGNIMDISLGGYQYQQEENSRFSVKLDWESSPSYFKNRLPNHYILPLHTAAIRVFVDSVTQKERLLRFSLERDIGSNAVTILPSNDSFSVDEIPFVTDNDRTAIDILKSDYAINIQTGARLKYSNPPATAKIIYSQPTDVLLRLMMHRSDNFFAEQALLMTSNDRLGTMNDSKIIDTILKTDFSDLPQKPRWADGSGLSRYNLFTPRDFVAILNKMKNEFGMPRLKTIFPTGGQGTIRNYYRADSNYIYAKTGTLSGVVAFSGFLYSKKNRLLLFSILVNNHQASSVDIRRATEKFLQEIRNKY